MKKINYLLLLTAFVFIVPINSFAKTFEKGKIEVYIGNNEDIKTGKYILEEEIVRFINEAEYTLEIAVQELRSGSINKDSNPIKEAVKQAASKGVKVRLIVETSYLTKNSDNLKTFEEFQNTPNISVIKDENPHIFHDKFIVRDKDKANCAILSGSTNFTDTGTRRNHNHIIIIHFEGKRKPYFEIADRYQAEFDELFNGTFGNYEPQQEIKTYKIGKTKITPLFSPDNDADDFLLKKVLEAESSIDVMMFTFGSNSTLLVGLINRFYAVKYVDRKPTKIPKIEIRVGLESVQAKYWSVYKTLKTLEIPTKLERTEAKLHHKVGIIDNKTVILGSYNWTKSANDDNDENTLVVNNPDIAQMFTEEFNYLWDNVLSD